jgi:hypothetical protein
VSLWIAVRAYRRTRTLEREVEAGHPDGG